MQRYRLDVDWLMIVPTTFSTEVLAESYEDAIRIAIDGANCHATSEWKKSFDVNENIYVGDDYNVRVNQIV